MKAYRSDLAYIHDAGFGGFSSRAAPWLLKTLRKHGITEGRVVDLGCGSGLWARALADAGYDVFGVDISDAMIRLSKARVPEGTFRRSSYLDVDLPECVAVTSLGECLNYLFDEKNGKRELLQLLRRVYEALQPGGVLIFDVAEPGRGQGPTMKHWEGKDWAILMSVKEDRRRRLLTRRLTTFRKVARHYRRDEEIHKLRLYEAGDLKDCLREIGYSVRIVRRYGATRFPKALAGFVAVRK